MKQSRITKPRLLVVALAVLLAASVGVVSSTASRASTTQLPKACSLLTKDEAQKLADADLAGVVLDAAQEVTEDFCEWDNPPEGYVAQVQLFIGDGAAKTLELDREKVKPVPGLGDEAYEEEGYIFARKGAVWIEIHLVRLSEWDPFWQPMRDTAALVLSRIPAGASETPEVSAPSKVVGKLPAGGGSNPLWKGAARRYGAGFAGLKGVVYQSNVVVIGGGASAIRGVSPDGLTWTVAGKAPGVADLKVGKIMLATSFAAGRVLAVSKSGPNVKVVLGPVTLTDVFRQATFDAKGAPVKQPLYHNTTLPTTQPKARTAQSVSAAAQGGGTFTTIPICCANTGFATTYDNGVGRATIAVNLYFNNPTVDFHIVIAGGSLKEASLALHGAAKLGYTFVAATKSVKGNVHSGPTRLPGSITIPLGTGPLSLTFTQSFDINIQLGGAAGFKTSGEFAVSGDLGFRYTPRGANPSAVVMATLKPFLEHTESFALGTSIIAIGWAVRATIGIGQGGFTAGAYFTLKPGVSIAMDGSFGSKYQGCVTAATSVTGEGGVGYTIPDYVLSIVNTILGSLKIKPIAGEGGPKLAEFPIFKPKPGAACPPGVTPPPLG
ncbi:MAG TPA: hypothetical protein VJT84_03485 [Gaiellaceae bacterium]|nr:hypothetical protein [Gaiellaceae bacterium]